MLKQALALFAFAAATSLTVSASAQSYGSLGNNPVGSHTHLGDRAIDTKQGGTLCAKTKAGVVCKSPAAWAKKSRH
jgi:hypothetical protein